LRKRLKIKISVTLGTFNIGKHAYNPMQEKYWTNVRMFFLQQSGDTQANFYVILF